jgi:O-antigen/teichoic acid export membrane protein
MISKITTSDIIGTSSTVISLAGIFSVVAVFGIDNGLQRFLGKSFAEKQFDNARVIVKASLVISSIGIVAWAAIIIIIKDWINDVFRIDLNLIIIIVLLMGSSAIHAVLYAAVISSLKTKILAKITILSSSLKLILAVVLILIGAGVLGLTLGYTFFGGILSSILLGFVIASILRSESKKEKAAKLEVSSFAYASKSILVAGISSWIPLLVTTVGSQLGTVVVFGSQGSSQAGIYFIALTIVTGLSSVMYSLFTVAFPALSAMQDGRKRFAWQTIRMSTIISLPFSSSLIFYSKDILQLIGQDYIAGSLSLQILLISILPSLLITGIETLVYSYGNYRHVLTIGLSTSIPRTILYFMLVPIYGSIGAATGYTTGSLIGLFISVIIAKRVGMLIVWKALALALIIPIALGFIFSYFHINYIIGIFASVIISYLFLLKLQILTKADIQFLLDLLPCSISNPITELLHRVDKK